MSFNTLLEILGALVAVVFILINLKAKKSLLGSFFKKYYTLVLIGAVFMFLGFTTESFGGLLGIPGEVNEAVHHVELIAFGIMFIYAARILPKEAVKHVEMK